MQKSPMVFAYAWTLQWWKLNWVIVMKLNISTIDYM